MREKVKIHINIPEGHVDRNAASDDWTNRKKDWNTMYRRNIHRFIQHYFRINLYPYQILWIYYMSICDYLLQLQVALVQSLG